MLKTYNLSSVSKVLGGQENYNSRQFSNNLTERRNGLIPEIGFQSGTRRLSFIKKIICPPPKPKKTKDDEFCCISKQEYCRLKRLDKQKAEPQKEKNKSDQKCTEVKPAQPDCSLREGCKICKKKMESVSSKAKRLLSMSKKKDVSKCHAKKKQPKSDPCQTKKPTSKSKEKASSDPCKNPFNQKESDLNAFNNKQVDKKAEENKGVVKENYCDKKKEEPKIQDEKSATQAKNCDKKKGKKANPCAQKKSEPKIEKSEDSKVVKDEKKPNKEDKIDCKTDEKLNTLVKPTESKTCEKVEESKTKDPCDKCSEDHCLEEKPSSVIMPKKESDGCKQLNLALVPVPESQLKKDVCGKKKSAIGGMIQKGKEWAANKSLSKDQNKNLKLMKKMEKEEMALNEEKQALLQKKKRILEERQLVEVEKNLCEEETSQFEKEKQIFTSEKKMLSDLKRCIERCEAEERKNNPEKPGKS